MEYWDLYDKDRNKLNKVVERGQKLNDDEYHLVVNAWLKNSKNEFLILQRSANKSFAFKWECVGGSVLKGETTLDAAYREVYEELGINLKTKPKLIGTVNRYYKNCPDILDVYLFECDVDIKDVVIQEEEVNQAKWKTSAEIKEMYQNNEFEANAFFEEALNVDEVYYIGFNANNAIFNENFFKGSITLYPTGEKGNIYYSDKLLSDTKSEKFMKNYSKYIYKTCKKIQNKNTKFICFNNKISELCSEMNDINIVKNNQLKLNNLLNNKFKTRELFNDIIPILDYHFFDNENLNYTQLRNIYNSDKFVIQGETGAGGDTTILATKQEDFVNTSNCCVSKYIHHLPLNITIIIGEYDIMLFPISVQLIKIIEHKFKYCGGDFIYANSFDENIINNINDYSTKIANRLKKMGYRGILGIDFMLSDKIYLTEINPRFQSSSFILSMYLEKYNYNIAELHYLAITNRRLPNIKLDNINNSFVNCNDYQSFDNLVDYKIINNGYFKNHKSSFYRKIFERSILYEDDFEKLN